MISKRTIIVAGGSAIALLILLVWLLCGSIDPREIVQGDWQEATSKLNVEVDSARAAARGAWRGSVSYEWLRADKKPYRVRFIYKNQEYEALVHIQSVDEVVVEPLIWDKLPGTLQRQLREINRRRNRPEKEFRLIFRRREKRKN